MCRPLFSLMQWASLSSQVQLGNGCRSSQNHLACPTHTGAHSHSPARAAETCCWEAGVWFTYSIKCQSHSELPIIGWMWSDSAAHACATWIAEAVALSTGFMHSHCAVRASMAKAQSLIHQVTHRFSPGDHDLLPFSSALLSACTGKPWIKRVSVQWVFIILLWWKTERLGGKQGKKITRRKKYIYDHCLPAVWCSQQQEPAHTQGSWLCLTGKCQEGRSGAGVGSEVGAELGMERATGPH